VNLTKEIIQGFVGSVLSSRFDQATKSPEFHLELWEYACSQKQYVAISAPRGHAKSTAGTLAYGLAELLFRCSRYLVIVSDTESQASMFVGAMRQEMQTNEDLIELFGIQKNEKGLVQFIKDTETDIIVQMADGHTFRVVGKGAEQKLRGMLWNGMRPDLLIIDDLENDELVMNDDRREKLRRWFRGALLPILSPKGKLRMWGTILHIDSVLNRFMPNESSRFVKDNGIKVWEEWPDGKIRGAWLSVKYRAHDNSMTEILWPERFPKKYWVEKRAEYSADGALDLYSQEFLNNPIDESVAYFKRSDLLPQTPEEARTHEVAHRLRYYCTVDMAISEQVSADYTVFCIAGVDENKTIFIKNIIRERLDGRDIVDYLLGLQKVYEFETVGIEDMMISKAIGPFLREEMVKHNVFLSIVPLKHKGKDKIQRARTIQARMRAKSVKFDKTAEWYPKLEQELITFPRGRHDDQVDALAYMGMLLDSMVEAQTDSEAEEEEHLMELAESGYNQSGRSAVTGY
jgi:predicted phage terminase large subunit-like protein